MTEQTQKTILRELDKAKSREQNCINFYEQRKKEKVFNIHSEKELQGIINQGKSILEGIEQAIAEVLEIK